MRLRSSGSYIIVIGSTLPPVMCAALAAPPHVASPAEAAAAALELGACAMHLKSAPGYAQNTALQRAVVARREVLPTAPSRIYGAGGASHTERVGQYIHDRSYIHDRTNQSPWARTLAAR